MMKNRSILLLVLAGIVLSCNGKKAPAVTETVPESVSQGKKVRGGELRFGLASELATLDPLDPANTADGRSVLFNVYEGLVKPDTDGSLLPAVAESFSINQNGLVYSFRIREGVKFHDGTTVKAEDAQFTLTKAMEARYTGFTDIEKIEITGEQELHLTLKNPDPDFLPYLTIGIVPKNNADRNKNPIGTGPFRIESYTSQQSLVLVRNSEYWRPELPYLDKVTLVFLADSDSLQIGLQGGNIDGASVTGSIISQMDLSRFEVVPGRSNMVQLLALNNEVKPLDNVLVRKALNYAIDAQEIIDAAFYGWGEPSGSPIIPGLKAVYETALAEPYPRNLDTAAELLAQAGYAGGFPLEITVPSNYSMHVNTAEVIVNQLSKIGITATIRLVDWASWLSDVYRGRKYQATIISFDGSTIPLSPRSFLGRYLSSAGGNLINFKNPEYDRVYSQALKETEQDRRNSLYKEAQRILSGEAASVFIQDIMAFTVFVKPFKGALNYPLNVIDFSVIYRTE
ncbi:MAG: ABC transporter substrate-binding protein [Treponema sp.]|nr:ABC transporter substrate-binding protein [Treponema sp.]